MIRHIVGTLLLASLALSQHPRPIRPHVVMFVIDDLGWADVGYLKGSDVTGATPVIDNLATTGILLDKYYLQPVCSPSRAAFMQGKYPWTTGLQHFNTIMPASSAAMPLNQPTMAELFQKANYRTAAVGKWHLGYARWSNTPTERGFESHKGYFQGEIGYYSKDFTIPSRFLPFINVTGLDWWTNKTVTRNEEKVYNKDLFDEEMLRVLNNYDPQGGKPLFMYYAHQVAHVPLDTPPSKWFQNCTHIKDPKRNTYCAMLAAVDDSLLQLIEKLKAKSMWDNTVLVVTSDNGAMPNIPGSFIGSAGVNFPFRGGKGTAFEGGVRGVGFVQGGDKVIPASARGTTISGPLLHAVDWFPTLLNMATATNTSETRATVITKSTSHPVELSPKKLALPDNLDGFDLWDVLVNNATISRTALPLNINYHIQFPASGHQIALIVGDWKLILQEVYGPVFNYDGWFPAPPAQPVPPPTVPSWESPYKFLFNLADDPYEHKNLFYEMPGKVAELQKVLDEFNKVYHKPQFNMVDPLGLPEFHHHVWAPFL